MRTIAEPTSMFRAAQLVGEAVQIANETVGKALASIKISGSSSILLGGRIGEAPPPLFLVYSAGNFIECKPDMPFFQIGETKYGRPILDRDDRAGHAARRGDEDRLPLVRRLDPLEPRGRPAARPDGDAGRARRAVLTRRIGDDDPYFNDLSPRWGDLLHDAAGAHSRPALHGRLDDST